MQINSKLYERQAIAEKVTTQVLDYYFARKKDNFTAEYALRNISSPIGVSEYKLLEDIPEYLQAQLPKAEEIELHIRDIEDI